MIDSNLMSEIQDAAAQGKDTLATEPDKCPHCVRGFLKPAPSTELCPYCKWGTIVRDGKNPLEALCIAMAHESIKKMNIFGRSISLDPFSVLRSLQEQGFDIVKMKP